MSDRAWLLKPEPLKVAKTCIQLVQGDINVKLPLSHPQFLEMLNDYADMMESTLLRQSVQRLNSLAGAQGEVFLKNAVGDNVVQHPSHVPARNNTNGAVSNISNTPSRDENETMTYRGKIYKRWQGSKEFSGLYRGQARYS
ncbi:MAG: hypothetical protein ACI90U_000825 [Pseudomonadales bacterium]